ncbi:hypothetical protein [Mangrovicoccus ximenensis]|uniref:hypothetical protein n=1 Tax=Mangrovicoccus ximenensis TaxID=1911570 RepID=UPI001F44DA2C|nr:hypothetical protein [Mangrovicoccus ximenensis]
MELGDTWSWCGEVRNHLGDRVQTCYSLDPKALDYERLTVLRRPAGTTELWSLALECARADCIAKRSRIIGSDGTPGSWDSARAVEALWYYRDNEDAIRSASAARKLLISQGASISPF